MGLPRGKLENIEAGWPTNVEWCCNQMLQLWLDTDTTASLEKIRNAIQQSTVFSNRTQASLHKCEYRLLHM